MKEGESRQRTINVVPLPKGLRYIYIYIRKEFVSDRPALSSKLGEVPPLRYYILILIEKGEESFYVYKKYIKNILFSTSLSFYKIPCFNLK